MSVVIYFIKNESEGAFLYPNRRRSGVSAINVIKKLCSKHLTTLEGYLKSVRLITNSRYRIPVVLSSKCVFFSTKGFYDYESIWVNYMEIKEIVYLEKHILFIFDEQYQLKVEFSTKNYQRLVTLIFKVLKYKDSLE
jgi:uncharacterized membrane protein YobD (UPF0266 family)